MLSGKVDLTVGRADGLRAGKVLVDLKTGGFSPSHREDLRFYALVETLRLGVPPRLLATYYLDGGRLQQEAVRTSDVGAGAGGRRRQAPVALLTGPGAGAEGRTAVPVVPIRHDCEMGRGTSSGRRP